MSQQEPNRKIFRFLRIISWPLSKLLFRYKRFTDPGIADVEGPLLIIANHTNFLDPIFVALALPNLTMNFVAGSVLMKNRHARKLMSALQVIPKLQFVTDTKALRSMLEIIKQDGRLALFPEARRSLDGGAEPFDVSTAKLVKRYRLNVVNVRTDGAYLAWPRWSKRFLAPGPVESRANLLLTREDTDRYTAEEIANILIRSLDGNDFSWQERRKRPARYLNRKRALGLHQLLHRCPLCLSDLAMTSTKKTLSCRACEYTVRLKSDMLFYPSETKSGSNQLFFPTIYDWHQWQKRSAANSRFALQQSWSFESKVVELSYSDDPETGLSMLVASGRSADGVVDVFPDRLTFTPADVLDEDMKVEIRFGTEPQQVFTNFSYVQLAKNGNLYNFFPVQPQNSIRVLDWVESRPSIPAETAGL